MMQAKIDDILLDEATEWFVRLRNIVPDGAGESLTREFRAWQSRSVAHRMAYEEVCLLWDDLAILEQTPETDPADRIPDSMRDVVQEGAPPVARRRSFHSFAALASALLLLVALTLVLTYRDVLLAERYETGIGEQADMVLEDGSHIFLNTDSRLRVAYREDQRRLYLDRGEAYFEVARDERRPFLVETAGGLVRVLGTKFNIRRDGAQSEVRVVEGAVGIMNHARLAAFEGPEAAPDATLTAAEGIMLGAAQGQRDKYAIDRAAARAWTDRKLVYNGESFARLVTDLDRYFPERIMIADPQLNRMKVVAILDVEDRESTLRAVEDTFGVVAVRTADRKILLYPRP